MNNVSDLLKRAGLTLALMATAVTSHANLIENGGFETPDIDSVVGERGSTSSTWQYYDSSVVDGFSGSNIELWNSGFLGVDAFEGDQFLELNSHPSSGGSFSIFQEFDTVVGQTYDLSFAYRARANSNEIFNLGLGSDSGFLFSQNIDDHTTSEWSLFSLLFTATDYSTTLTFTSVVPESHTVGNFLDDVKVSAVPELSAAGGSVALFLAMGLISLLRERKK